MDKCIKVEIPTEEEFESMTINEQVDLIYKSAKNDVEMAIKGSCKSRAVWLATSDDAPQMLAEWKAFQVSIKDEYGVDVPDLIEGVKVNIS